jgi:plasmid stabilization system protein ParE
MHNIIVRLDAEADITEAHNWYNEQTAGVGEDFIAAVDACLSRIQAHPFSYPVIRKKVRRALLQRFPYALFYLTQEDTIVIIACFHVHRDPKHWQKRALH